MHYLKIELRRLWKNKVYSTILLGSLSVGMSAVLVIILFLKTEHEFDRFHAKGDRIFRITTKVKQVATGETRHYATTMPPVAKCLKNEYPQVEEAVRFRRSDNHIVNYNDKRFIENRVLFADSGFFRIFSFQMKAGSAETALSSPNSVVLTESVAAKYFGTENPVGKILKVDSSNWQVTGVIANIPVNSHFQPDFIVSFDTWKIPVGYPVTFESWTWLSFPTYILLKENAAVSSVQRDLPRFAKKYGGDEIASRREFELQPLKNIYFAGDLLGNDTFKTGNKKQSTVLVVIALLILLVGAFNFMTLFTASCARRAKEVGIRKVVGAARYKLLRQISGEAILLSLICVPVAILLAVPSARWISLAMDFPLLFSTEQLYFSVAICLGIALVIGFLAGIYPALKLTAFAPSVSLRSLFKVPAGISFKKALVVTQFSISAVLLLAVLVMFKQSSFISNKHLGFEHSAVLNIEMPGDQLETRFDFIRSEIKKTGMVAEVSKGADLFAEAIGSVPVYPDRSTDRDMAVQMNIQGVHYGFFETFGMQLLHGRFISNQFPSDSADAIVINEAVIKAFGWKGNPVGRKLQIGEIKPGTIVGVVKDFNFRSLHSTVAPLVMFVPPTRLGNIFVKVNPGKLIQAARLIENKWSSIAGDIPFNLSFVDQNIDSLYSKDRKFMRLVFIFCSLSVFVACIGLYALTILMAGQRTKEIGIRKVLGASVAGVIFLLSRDFFKLVVVAVTIAFPAAWWAMNKWLEGYAYKINIGAGTFIIVFTAIVALTLLTVSFQAIKAAIANPVKALRTE